MSITAGAALWEFGAQATIISDASGAVPDAFTVAGDATALVQTDFCPLGDVTLKITYGTAVTAGDAIHLYRRDMNMNDANDDADTPTASNKSTYVGSFPLNVSTSEQIHHLTDIPLVVDQEFYIEYDVTTVNTTATTLLTIKPKSYNAKAA